MNLDREVIYPYKVQIVTNKPTIITKEEKTHQNWERGD